MNCRKSVAELQPYEKEDYCEAVLQLKNPSLATNPAVAASRIPDAATAVSNAGGTPNRYDDYVWMHNQIGGGAHRGPAFGPWHREFLRQFEYDLQQVSGNPEIFIPYWDWTIARAPGDPGWPFTPGFMGGFGDATTGMLSPASSDYFGDSAEFRMNIRLAGDSDLTLKRRRGIPPAGDLPGNDFVRHAFGVELLSGIPVWPQAYDAPDYHHDPAPPSTQQQNTTALLASFRKFLEWLLHDGVHGWVGDSWDFDTDGGHMTFPAVAVNDPVFFLHHCMVDRLWAIWQRKSPTPAYAPATGSAADPGHNGNDVMGLFNNPAHFNTTLNQHPNDVQDHHAIGYWYHRDPPVITPASASVNFGSVPELLTTFRPIQFQVRTCQPVTFTVSIPFNPRGNFSVPASQGSVIVDHAAGSDIVTANVYVQFQANGALGTAQNAQATVQATIIDVDGYDAATPGGVHVVGTWPIDLIATPVSRPRAAVAFVLDRSGSMSESAGIAGTKYDLLKESIDVVADVMRDIDGLGIVTFDHAVTTLNGILEMGPNTDPPSAGTGRDAAVDAIASPDLVPRGLTGIGQGMIQGAGVLDAERSAATTPYDQFAMLVMTDGNQNQSPSVLDAPVTSAISPYNESVYAIGLGRTGNVSDTTLGQIANYMLVTGDITAAERRFRLTKYFIQILAGVTRSAIIVDPDGDLMIGSEHVIPFSVADTDVEMDVIALSPIAPLLELELEAPDGTRIDPGFGAPTVSHFVNVPDQFYRLTLPVDPGIPREGEWKAILRLNEKTLRNRWNEREKWDHLLDQLRKTGTLPYSLIVQSYSNLEMTVLVRPTVVLAGEVVGLHVVLTEYGQPLGGKAEVTVHVTDPFGTVSDVRLYPVGEGAFKGEFITTFPGLLTCRFMAIGATTQGQLFQREETRTVSVFRDGIPEGKGSEGDDKERGGEDEEIDLDRLREEDPARFCRLVFTAIEDQAVAKKLGIKPEEAKEYYEKYCERR